MSRPHSFLDAHDWPLPPGRRESTVSSSTQSSGTLSFTSNPPFPPPSPVTSSPGSRSRQPSCHSLYDEVVRLPFSPAVTMYVLPHYLGYLVGVSYSSAYSSFVRHNKVFRLRYQYVDIRKDSGGSLKSLELGGGVGQQTPFVHTCECILPKYFGSHQLTDHPIVHTTRLPVPHLEHPKLPNEASLRISFLEEQTVQTAHTVFMTQISYIFEDWNGKRNPAFTAPRANLQHRLRSVSRTDPGIEAGLHCRDCRGKIQGPRGGMYQSEFTHFARTEWQAGDIAVCQFATKGI
ncbi:uncharacterized protein LDX57_006172 [Aspergillus melleus]|uniref:uncharacterized protein n=1 Tax=Aspergillus melleus TaxID=138277 RepID=UPI001E8D6A5F|nr:uncharacterized protein LDX57_006172 [Aspergillus melleus]KAH8428473.1 hypothetical protein LDX57_006172 [Aspergillus melleus]